MFSSLKQQAEAFLEQYKQKEPAVYAAAEQAIGGLLITDGLFGIPNPFGGKKRPGIFGAVGGVLMGVVLLFVPVFIGNISGINSMTATTSATVVSVGIPSPTTSSNANGGTACSLTVSYSVNGTQYTKPSALNSSSNCALTQGQVITINYNPANPGSWAYGTKTIGMFLWIFFGVGILIIIASAITFVIRLLSIIFGWKILKDGRKNAAALPADTNFQTMVEEIKKNFVGSVFGFGGTATPPPSGGGISS